MIPTYVRVISKYLPIYVLALNPQDSTSGQRNGWFFCDSEGFVDLTYAAKLVLYGTRKRA